MHSPVYHLVKKEVPNFRLVYLSSVFNTIQSSQSINCDEVEILQTICQMEKVIKMGLSKLQRVKVGKGRVRITCHDHVMVGACLKWHCNSSSYSGHCTLSVHSLPHLHSYQCTTLPWLVNFQELSQNTDCDSENTIFMFLSFRMRQTDDITGETVVLWIYSERF